MNLIFVINYNINLDYNFNIIQINVSYEIIFKYFLTIILFIVRLKYFIVLFYLPLVNIVNVQGGPSKTYNCQEKFWRRKPEKRPLCL